MNLMASTIVSTAAWLWSTRLSVADPAASHGDGEVA